MTSVKQVGFVFLLSGIALGLTYNETREFMVDPSEGMQANKTLFYSKQEFDKTY